MTTKKKKNRVPLLDRKGETYKPPAVDACSKMCVTLPEFKEFAKYISTILHIHSPIPICSDAESLEDVMVLLILHFQGDTNLDMLKKFGTLWKTENGLIGEPCIRFLVVMINRLIYATTGKKIHSNKTIAIADIHMCLAPNNYGGAHNSNKICSMSRDVLVAAIEKFPKLQTIIPFGKQPSLFVVNHLLPKFQEEQYIHILPRFQPAFRKEKEAFFSKFGYIHHPRSYLMGRTTIEHAQDLF